MTDLSKCTWQTLDLSDTDKTEDAVIYASFPGRSRQLVQWVANAGPFIVQPYNN